MPAHLHGGSPTCCCGLNGSLQVGRGSLGVGGLGEPQILLIMKKGYKQVMKKISNEIKRM